MVARVRAASASRTTPWTHAELAASVPTLLVPQPTWKATASHSAPSRIGMTGEPMGAFDFEGWTTGVPQQPGMWWQLELPEAQNVAELHFYSPNGGGGGGGRGRGAGAANAAPPPPPQTTAPRGYQVQLSMDGTTWSHGCRRHRNGEHDRRQLDAVASAFHSCHSNGHHPERAGMVHAGDEALHSAGRSAIGTCRRGHPCASFLHHVY